MFAKKPKTMSPLLLFITLNNVETVQRLPLVYVGQTTGITAEININKAAMEPLTQPQYEALITIQEKKMRKNKRMYVSN